MYTVRVSRPASQRAEVEVQVPTGRAASVEMMMPLWSPGFYRVEDYASRVEDFAARSADGAPLPVEKTRPNRWRIGTNGAPMVFVTYRLLCDQRSVTTNWISEELGVLNGAATFITLVEKVSRPHHVMLERPPGWKRAMTGLEAGPDYYRALDYDELVDSPIVAGDLSVHEFKVAGTPHALVDAGERGSWDGRRAATDLARMVSETRRFWGVLPYKRYVLLNVFRPGGGGLEHASGTVSYYVKGHVVGFLLDAKVRRATGGRKSLRDVMRLAYARYSGERGFTPEEFEAIAQEVAGEDLTLWFHRAVASTEELDYAEALDWFGLRFVGGPPPGAAEAWKLEPRPNPTRAQRRRLKHP